MQNVCVYRCIHDIHIYVGKSLLVLGNGPGSSSSVEAKFGPPETGRQAVEVFKRVQSPMMRCFWDVSGL